MRTIIVLAGIVLAGLSACDRQQPAPEMRATRPAVQMSTIHQLPPGLPTHVAVEPHGNIAWVQESAEGRDVLYWMAVGRHPQKMRLTSEAVMAALGEAGGRGTFQSLYAVGDDRIWFYFSGSKEQRSASCIGEFAPRRNEFRVLYGTDALRMATGMSALLVKARGKLFGCGTRAWFWLRSADAWFLRQMDVNGMLAEGDLFFPQRYAAVRCDDTDLPMTRSEYDLVAGHGETLYLTDLWLGAIWKIDEEGSASVVATLTGLPEALSEAVVDGDGRLLMFASVARPIESRTESALDMATLQTQYPAMLKLDRARLSAIGREDLIVPANVPLPKLRLQQLQPELGGERWIAYDANSGWLLRLQMSQTESPQRQGNP